jgi:lysophospholipase L1-like esterase
MWRLLILLLCACLAPLPGYSAEFLPGVKRILFLGDSITHSGAYVDDFETFLAVKYPARDFTVINCGLPSETVSGLSEAGHAGGKFPRPDLHERLDRVLELTKPELVFACYGINCGIYLPPDPARLAKYQEGIVKLKTKVEAAGAKIILLTPMLFDPLPLKGRTKSAADVKDGEMYEGYDEVLEQFTTWLLGQRDKEKWQVINAHGAMKEALAEARKTKANYRFAGDGVHANEAGHYAVSSAMFQYFGQAFDPADAAHKKVRDLVHDRGRILREAYLETAGHKRPGMSKGLPLAEAQAKAAELTAQIRTATAEAK